MQTVAILGCGWLGLPLAKTMIANGMTVKGSTTSTDKLVAFKKDDIEPYLITLEENTVNGDITGFLDQADILIIDIPPKAKSGENFSQKIKTLIPCIAAAGIGKVLFVSSTSVFADDNSVVTDRSVPRPETESGKQLLGSERLLQENTAFQTTILRFGGLVGEDRHPVYHLAGRQNLANPDGPVNLIHRNDCIGIILMLIEKGIWGEVYNAVAPYHPTRMEYYTAKAALLSLPQPLFAADGVSAGKTISAVKVQDELGYVFSMPL